jgi:calpain-15
VLILEKAWAKVFGSYQRIEAGTTGEALMPLTGCPNKRVNHQDYKNKENMWQLIIFADKHKFPMCTAVASVMEEGDVDEEEIKNFGLIDAHAYSLISA